MSKEIIYEEKSVNEEYSKSGVANDSTILKSLSSIQKETYQNQENHQPLLKHNYYANVIDIGNGEGIAICTDGIGNKINHLEWQGKFYCMGYDLVAMSVNDIICVGAKPISFVDYINCDLRRPSSKKHIEEFAIGLRYACNESGVSLSGGETAQQMGSNVFNDICGTAIGIVKKHEIIDGTNIEPGDIIYGLESSGFHCNGYSLLREKIHSKNILYNTLIPTNIYVNFVMNLLEMERKNITGLFNITGGGFKNLLRGKNLNGNFYINNLPSKDDFSITQREMWELVESFSCYTNYQTFNMGIGFVITSKQEIITNSLGMKIFKIGEVIRSTNKCVTICSDNMIGYTS